MVEVRQTAILQKWLERLDDNRSRERIVQRIVRLQSGLMGDVKPVGERVSELRIDHGPRYRVHFVRRGRLLIILLCGGNKGTQRHDIAQAKKLAAEVESQ